MSVLTSTPERARAPIPPARGAAIAAGAALAAMAALAPPVLLVAIPHGLAALGAIGALVIAALDAIVALALVPVLEPGGRVLAQTTAALRVAYAAVFAVAASELLASDDLAAAARFDRVWDAALFLFGVHLVLLGVLVWRAPGAPRWLGALVGIGGLAYLADTVIAAVAPASGVSVGAVSAVGEIALAVWLLARGGRGSGRRGDGRRSPAPDAARPPAAMRGGAAPGAEE